MEQMLLFGKRRQFKTPRPRKITLSARGIYEPVELEKDVLELIYSMLWYCGIPVFRERERIPYVQAQCDRCRNKFNVRVGEPSEAGHPDLHGYVPIHTFIRFAITTELKTWARFSLRFPVPFYIEVKRPKGGVRRPAQEAFVERAKEHKVPTLFARRWAEVRDEFSQIGLDLPEGWNEVARHALPLAARHT